MAAYLIGGRPQSHNRRLFLSFFYPYHPVTAATVIGDLRKCIRQANLPGSAYWLRHTYAQNLLESDASVFEIKQMLGHDSIESSKRYLHIHTKLMRKVLFDETV
jgi:site-specific recombinase XerD